MLYFLGSFIHKSTASKEIVNPLSKNILLPLTDRNNMDQQHHQGRKKLPNLKKLLDPVYEELRSNILEVLGASGVCFEYYELKDTPINEWYKLHKGLWDEHTGVLGRSYLLNKCKLFGIKKGPCKQFFYHSSIEFRILNNTT